MIIEDLSLSPGENDGLTLPKDGNSLEYQTKDGEAITVRIGEAYKGADYELKIRPESNKGGYKLAIRNVVDSRQGKHELILTLANDKHAQSNYLIEMIRIDKETDNFSNRDSKALTIGRNETNHIEYGKWIKDSQPLLVLVDKDSDGKIDLSKKVPDQN